MSELKSLGVNVERSFQTSSTSINGIQVGGNETTKLTLTLPRAVEIKATFSKEGLGRKLVKLFKKELQTGDKAFDDAIYISTDTPEATKALLESADVRGAIMTCVTTGGPLEIEGAMVTTELPGRHEDGDDTDTLVLIRALLG
jgi:hypothetical protein